MAEHPTAGKIAEVVEASSVAFTAQCYRLYEAPPLGALVRAGRGPEVYGVVGYITTGPVEPGRRPLPRGEDLEDEEEVERAHPHLPRLLCTTFQAVIVGYREGEALHYGLPPVPPKVHAFVYPCGSEELRRFTRSLEFLRLLLGAPLPTPPDEVVSAFLRGIASTRPEGEALLLQAGRALARELGRDTVRLTALLRRVRG